ncbi:HEPN domain-containing protein [Paenibacillus sp. Leaf72]|uniref:ApeA N-terminal domain 1-containing protein n=1 Tax=Paenibacillus sp. Leaf72 TaxID=1736234 RepID=UPI0006F6C059|nr:HEPN domain-containing protein [Paenibacillus sp. Leaf72]KQN96792.1 hypothetical protein ASF12_22225 [Paenibacillus sp. Leaf72]
MGKKVGIYENVEYRGSWWVPGEEDKKVYGVLIISKRKQIKLEVIGDAPIESSLLNSESTDFPIVLGDCYDDKVTLVSCLDQSIGMRFDVFAGIQKKKVSMVFEFALFGEHFYSPADLCFQSMYVEFSNLNHWMDQAPFSLHYFGKLEYKEHEIDNINLQIQQFNMNIKSGISYEDITNRHDTVGLRYTFQVLFETKVPQTLGWFLKRINKFKHFLSIYTDSLDYVLSMQGFYGDKSKFVSICTIPLPDYHKTDREFNAFKMPIKIMYENISDILNNWYQFEHEEILYTYIGNIPNDRKTIQEKFLGYARVIESLHRFQNPGSGKNTYFSTRIKDTLGALPHYFAEKATLGKQIQDFAKMITAERNYYTHFGDRPNNLISDYAMIGLNHSLKLICFWIISRKIGISEAQLTEQLNNDHTWLKILNYYQKRF